MRVSLLGLQGCSASEPCQTLPPGQPPLLCLLLRPGRGLSTHAPTRVHVHACTRVALGLPHACPAHRAWRFDSAPSLFLPVSHFTPHQLPNCLFTRSPLVRCDINLIREQKVAHCSFGGPGSGKGLKLGLSPALPPQPTPAPWKMLGAGTPGWVRATSAGLGQRSRASQGAGDRGSALHFSCGSSSE